MVLQALASTVLPSGRVTTMLTSGFEANCSSYWALYLSHRSSLFWMYSGQGFSSETPPPDDSSFFFFSLMAFFWDYKEWKCWRLIPILHYFVHNTCIHSCVFLSPCMLQQLCITICLFTVSIRNRNHHSVSSVSRIAFTRCKPSCRQHDVMKMQILGYFTK